MSGAGLPSRPERGLDGPAAYQAFVQSLFAKVQPRLAAKLDPDVQVEIAGLARLLASMPRPVIEANRIYFELAFELLGA